MQCRGSGKVVIESLGNASVNNTGLGHQILQVQTVNPSRFYKED